MEDSPPSPYIVVRGGGGNALVVKTQPFYSVFYETKPKPDDKLLAQIKEAANRSIMSNRSIGDKKLCKNVLLPLVPKVSIIDDIPFNLAGKNAALFGVVFIAATVMGVLVFSYWAHVVGVSDNTAAAFNPVLEKRSIYLSLLFIATVALLSVMAYELFTLKRLSRQWFLGVQAEKPGEFYSFLLSGRRLAIWAFLLAWLAIVAYTVAVLARRPEAFREQIITNVIAALVLLVSQYIYHRASSPVIRSFALLASVCVVGFIIILLHLA